MNTLVKLKPHENFERHFRVKSLKLIYEDRLQTSKLKGVDRLTGQLFSAESKWMTNQLRLTSRKALNGTYNFSPYLELLKGKGRGQKPRVLAIPTIRDRIVLYALKEVLFDLFPDCVNRSFSNSVIHKIKVQTNRESDFGFFRTDIENFYGSINRDTLLSFIKRETRSKKILKMVERAITRPIVPKIYKRNDTKKHKMDGVPQGLSISNILAEIYMQELDFKMESDSRVFSYSRYVDDILILAPKSLLADVVKDLRIELEGNQKLGLKLNRCKTRTNVSLPEDFEMSESFEYLGYQFDSAMSVSPKKSSEERLIRSLTGLFCEYKNEFYKLQKSRKREKNKRRLINCLRKVLAFRINERITGAISEKKKYGWIFYFSEISDISSLYRIDRILSGLIVKNSGTLGTSFPHGIKKISRAYYEAKYTPTRGYIHNYNDYQLPEQKRGFMIENGYIEDPSKPMSLKKINRKFYAIKNFNLSKLIADETFLY